LVNFSDLPELLPGAYSNATLAQREEFEEQCRQLYNDGFADKHQANCGAVVEPSRPAVDVTSNDLVAMFPSIDPKLVRTLMEEAQTPQDAIETLLEIAATIGDLGEVGQRVSTPPPLNLGVEDMQQFPTLMDADGWQVVSQHQFERDPEENLGSAWRDRAKAAVPLPAPVPMQSHVRGKAASRKRERKEKESDITDNTDSQLDTDFDLRHKKGEQRANNRVQFGRGSRMALTVAYCEHTGVGEDVHASEIFDEVAA
jgi:hypothetical protein